jgi:hypothetical protein
MNVQTFSMLTAMAYSNTKMRNRCTTPSGCLKIRKMKSSNREIKLTGRLKERKIVAIKLVWLTLGKLDEGAFGLKAVDLGAGYFAFEVIAANKVTVLGRTDFTAAQQIDTTRAARDLALARC